jgi:hypothetical protein
MAERFALGDYDQFHHFIAAEVRDAGPVETELLLGAARRWLQASARQPRPLDRALAFLDLFSHVPRLS